MNITASGRGKRSSPKVVLILLLVAYILNYIDRTLIGILAVPMKADLELTDTQLGLMVGLPFAFFYAGLGVPIAWLADRRSRVNIIAVSVTIWSAFTAACGLCQNYWQLIIARMGVGVGEAGGTAPSISLLTDYFPPEQRARAMAIFLFGVPIGGASGIVFGGWIASSVDWRVAFLVSGAIGIPVALLLKLFVIEPERGAVDGDVKHVADAPEAPSVGEISKVLAKTPSYWFVLLAGVAPSIPIMGLSYWIPSYFARNLGLNLMEVVYFYGPVVLIGGIAGMWLGGWASDRLGRVRLSAYPLVAAISYILATPLFAIFLFTSNLAIALPVYLVAQVIGYAALSPQMTCIQQIVPATMRTTASATYLFSSNLVGLGLGSLFYGGMSDWFSHSYPDDALRYSILSGLAFFLVGAFFALLAVRTINRDFGESPSAAVAVA